MTTFGSAMLCMFMSVLSGCLVLEMAGLGPIRRLFLPLFLSLGFLTGISLLSCYSMLLSLVGPWSDILFGDVILCSFLLILSLLLRSRKTEAVLDNENVPDLRHVKKYVAFVVVVICIGLIPIFQNYLDYPYGHGDSYTQTYYKARFLYYGHGDLHFLNDSSLPKWVCPAYPLFLPFAVARVWEYAGTASPMGSIILQISLYIAFLTVIFSLLSFTRGYFHGSLAVIAVVGMRIYNHYMGWQYTDPVFAAYLTTGLLLLVYKEYAHESLGGPLVLLSGFMLGSTAWIKNEGMPVIALLLIFFGAKLLFYRSRRVFSEMALIMAGVLPPVLTRCAFMVNTPRVDLMNTSITIEAAIGRIPEIFQLLVPIVMRFSSWMTLLIVVLYFFMTKKQWLPARCNILATFILGSMAVGYFMVYVFSPYNIQWHIKTSADRIIMIHIFLPAALVLLANTAGGKMKE